MAIGDKVKLRNTNETGVITNVLKGDMIEVALDGWNSKQLFSKNELTLISKSSDNQSVEIVIAGKAFEKGIFLAFVPQKRLTGESLILNLINNSNSDFAFTISIDKNDKSTGVMAGFLKGKTFQSANKDFFISNFDEWETLTFSALF